MKIEVKNVSKRFKDELVLKDVNYTFETGKIYGLIGKNGSGKSVFLKMICGFYYPTTGQILFDGVDYICQNKFPQNLRALIEKPSFIESLSGYDNLKLLSEIQNTITDEDIINTLKLVHLEDVMNKKYSKYSLGMKQKLGIAQVLMESPEIIILDEPFNGIEENTAKELRELLDKLKKEKIIILATHMKEDIIDITDCVLEFENNTIKENN